MLVCVIVPVNADTVDWNDIEIEVRYNDDDDADDDEDSVAIHILWPDPESPNGVILTYELELSRADVPNVRAMHTPCFTSFWLL